MKNEQNTPEQIKQWLTDSYRSSNNLFAILENKYSEDKDTKRVLGELKHHVKVLS